MASCANVVGTAFTEGKQPEVKQQRTTGGSAFYRVYDTSDGRQLVLAGQEMKFIRNLLGALGKPEMVALCEWPGPHQKPVMDFLAATFREKPLAHWMAWLDTLDICYGPVNTLPEAIVDPNLLQAGRRRDGFRRPQALRARRALQGRAVAPALSRAAAGRAYGGSAGASRRAQETGRVTDKRGPWSIVSTRQAYDNRWIRVSHHEVITPSGDAGIYGTIHYKNRALGIVPVDAEQHTFLVGQYRFALDAYSWEIPEGGGPLDVDFLESAKRELREETGLSARRWHKLFESDLSNSVNDEKAIAFLACQLAQGQAAPELDGGAGRASSSPGGGVPDGRGGRDQGCHQHHGAAGRRAACPQGTPRSPVEVSDSCW